MTTSKGDKNKELDKIEGIMQYPDVAGLQGFKRDVRYAVACASRTPKLAVDWLSRADQWTENPMTLPEDPEFETLGIKLGKALRSIVKGEKKRELQVLEDKMIRESGDVIDGRRLYCWILRGFDRDLKLARPLMMAEVAALKLDQSKDPLTSYMNRWEAAMERFNQTGREKGDEEFLFVHFKTNFFMECNELSEYATQVRRAKVGSKRNTYAWMYKTTRELMNTLRLERQEAERTKALLPNAPQPLTPGLDTKGKGGARSPRAKSPGGGGKGGGKGRDPPTEAQLAEKKKVACPRMVKGLECTFEDRCWYTHSQSVVDKAKAALKKEGGSPAKKTDGQKSPRGDPSKRLCHFFKKGKCNNGDKCAYSHDLDIANVAVPCVIGLACAMVQENSDTESSKSEVSFSCEDEVFEHEIFGNLLPIHDKAACERVNEIRTAFPPTKQEWFEAHGPFPTPAFEEEFSVPK